MSCGRRLLKRNNRCSLLPLVCSCQCVCYHRHRCWCHWRCYCVVAAAGVTHRRPAKTMIRPVTLTIGQSLHLVWQRRLFVDVTCPVRIRLERRPVAGNVAVTLKWARIWYSMVRLHRHILRRRPLHRHHQHRLPYAGDTFGMTRSNSNLEYCYC